MLTFPALPVFGPTARTIRLSCVVMLATSFCSLCLRLFSPLPHYLQDKIIQYLASADFANRCQDLDKLPRSVGGWVGAATRLYCYRGGASGARGRFRLAWLRQPLSWLYRPFDVPSTGGGVPVTGSGMGLRRSKSSRYVGQRPKGYMAPSNLHIHGGLWR